jgi:predicted RNA-binding Zn-ribbon protein involved in translation (DUF1610 family)
MSTVMTRCPNTGRAVSTGINTASVKFDSLPDVGVRMLCPACGREHVWRKREAWLAHDATLIQSSDSAA